MLRKDFFSLPRTKIAGLFNHPHTLLWTAYTDYHSLVEVNIVIIVYVLQYSWFLLWENCWFLFVLCRIMCGCRAWVDVFVWGTLLSHICVVQSNVYGCLFYKIGLYKDISWAYLVNKIKLSELTSMKMNNRYCVTGICDLRFLTDYWSWVCGYMSFSHFSVFTT